MIAQTPNAADGFRPQAHLVSSRRHVERAGPPGRRCAEGAEEAVENGKRQCPRRRLVAQHDRGRIDEEGLPVSDVSVFGTN